MRGCESRPSRPRTNLGQLTEAGMGNARVEAICCPAPSAITLADLNKLIQSNPAAPDTAPKVTELNSSGMVDLGSFPGIDGTGDRLDQLISNIDDSSIC